MEDSHAALAGVCFALRERYNKLRTEHRRVLKSRTCVRCRSRLDHSHQLVTTGTATSTCDDQFEGTSDVSAAAKLQLNAICEELERFDGVEGDAAGALRDVIPRLRQIADSFPASRDRETAPGESRTTDLTSSTTATDSNTSGNALCHMEEQRHDGSVSDGLQEDVSHGMESNANSTSSGQKVNSEMTGDAATDGRALQSEDDINEDDQIGDNSPTAEHAPWSRDLTKVAELATNQYTELKAVCQNLQQQNEMLKKIVKWKLSDNHSIIGCDENFTDSDWSLLQPT